MLANRYDLTLLAAVTLGALASCSRDAPDGGGSSSAAANAPRAALYEGTLDVATCGVIRGWAMETGKPDTPVSVEIMDGTKPLATVVADEFREGLLKKGKGNGKHQFSYVVPPDLKDRQPHEIHARIAGTGFELKSSPKTINCPSK